MIRLLSLYQILFAEITYSFGSYALLPYNFFSLLSWGDVRKLLMLEIGLLKSTLGDHISTRTIFDLKKKIEPPCIFDRNFCSIFIFM